MRIVVDMQGAQSTASRTRGIGRYTMSLSEALAAQSGGTRDRTRFERPVPGYYRTDPSRFL